MTHENDTPSLLLRASTVARMLEIGERTLWRWVSEGDFPSPDYRKNERIVRWKRDTVMNWVHTNTTTTAAAITA